MNEDELDQLVRRARPGFQPRAEAKARLHRSLVQKLAVGGTVLASSRTGWASVATKVLLGVGGLSVVATAWILKPAPTARSRNAVTPPDTALGTAPRTVVSGPDLLEQPTAVGTSAPPTPTAVQKTARAATKSDSLLAEESALLLDARSALRAGKPSAALALLLSYESRFERGVLRQEVQGTRILALCDLGRVAEAKRGSKEFMKRWPNSPIAARLSMSCVAGGSGRAE